MLKTANRRLPIRHCRQHGACSQCALLHKRVTKHVHCSLCSLQCTTSMRRAVSSLPTHGSGWRRPEHFRLQGPSQWACKLCTRWRRLHLAATSQGAPLALHIPAQALQGCCYSKGTATRLVWGGLHPAACSCRKAACALHPKGHSWLPGSRPFMLHARHMRATCYMPDPGLCMLRSTCLLPVFACYSMNHACYMTRAGPHADYMSATCVLHAAALPRLPQRAAHNRRHPLPAGTTLSATCNSCLLSPLSRCWCQ